MDYDRLDWQIHNQFYGGRRKGRNFPQSGRPETHLTLIFSMKTGCKKVALHNPSGLLGFRLKVSPKGKLGPESVRKNCCRTFQTFWTRQSYLYCCPITQAAITQISKWLGSFLPSNWVQPRWEIHGRLHVTIKQRESLNTNLAFARAGNVCYFIIFTVYWNVI